MKGKPCPWGIKVYVLCGSSGQPYDFFLYQGAAHDIDPLDLKQLGFGASVVLKFSERLSQCGHTIYCDNFFTTYQLLEVMKEKKINLAGTVRLNRFANPPLLSDKDMRKKPKGSSDSVTSLDGK